jgi:hypothetical protein
MCLWGDDRNVKLKERGAKSIRKKWLAGKRMESRCDDVVIKGAWGDSAGI